MLSYFHCLVWVKPRREALTLNPSPKVGRGTLQSGSAVPNFKSRDWGMRASYSSGMHSRSLPEPHRSLTAPNPIETVHAPAVDEVQDGRSSWSTGSGGNRNAPSRTDLTPPELTTKAPSRDRQPPPLPRKIIGTPFSVWPFSCPPVDNRDGCPNLLAPHSSAQTGQSPAPSVEAQP